MSSTNRGGQRHISDYYVTPVSDIKNLLQFIQSNIPSILDKDNYILDPCAGGDGYVDMSYPKALKEFGILDDHITTVDWRDDSRAKIKQNYLLVPFENKFDLTITNPPFDQAIQIIRKALSDTAIDGYVIMLLRLNFFGSASRFQFWKDNMPEYTVVHHSRISFTGGTTDSIEYMHAIWKVGFHPEFTKLKIV